MKKLKKIRSMVATILIASLIFPTHLPSIADVIENEEKIAKSENYTDKENLSVESEAFNENVEVLSDIIYIEGERIPEELIGDEKEIYFGKVTVELKEGDNSIYYLPIYRTGDLSNSESIKIRTLDVASLYSKDYELLGDDITEYVSEMTLLERSLKGEKTDKLVKKKFEYNENTDEINYLGEEETDIEKYSRASISEMIDNGFFDYASDSEADYQENNSETETSTTETTVIETDITETNVDEPIEQTNTETEVSPDTEPSIEESTTYEEEKEEDETTAITEESTFDSNESTTNENIEKEITGNTENINSENNESIEPSSDINEEVSDTETIASEELAGENVTDTSNATEVPIETENIENETEILDNETTETSEEEPKTIEEMVEETSEEMIEGSNATNESSSEKSVDETVSGFTGTKFLLSNDSQDENNNSTNEINESSQDANENTENNNFNVENLNDDDKTNFDNKIEDNNEIENVANYNDLAEPEEIEEAVSLNNSAEVEEPEEAKNGEKVEEIGETEETNDSFETSEYIESDEYDWDIDNMISTDSTLDPIVIPEEDVIYIDREKDANFIMDTTGDSIGKSQLALDKERQTGESTRVTERSVAGSLTEAIMSKLTPEIMQHIIYSAEQTITFKENEDTTYVKFRLLDDDISEGKEMFSIMIAETEVSKTYVNVASINIEDDEEVVKSKITFDKKSYNIKDGQVSFKLKREDAEYTMVSVNVDTIDDKTKIETTHGIVLFAPYETEREITLNLNNDSEIKLSDYSYAEEGKIVKVKAKRTLIDKFLNKNSSILTASGDRSDNIFSKSIKIGDTTYTVKILPGENIGTIYDIRFNPPMEVGKYFTMAIKDNQDPKAPDDQKKYHGMWTYHITAKPSSAYSEYRKYGAENNLLDSHGAFRWYSSWSNDEGQSDARMTHEDSKIHSIYYRALIPYWKEINDKYGGQEMHVWYAKRNSKGQSHDVAHHYRSGKFGATIDVSNKYTILNKNDTSIDDRNNEKMTICIGARDTRGGKTPDIEGEVYGIVAMYKKYRIETLDVDKFSYKTGLNSDGTYSTLQYSPAGFIVNCGGHNIVGGSHDDRFIYANADEILKPSRSGSIDGIPNNMVFTLTANKINGETNVFGQLVGYKVTVNFQGDADKRTTFNYPEDFVNYLRSSERVSNDVIKYDKDSINYEVNNKILNHISTVPIDRYFIDYIEHLQKEVRIDDNDYSDAYFQELLFKPIFKQQEVKVSVVRPTGILNTEVGGWFKDSNLRPFQASPVKFYAGDRLDLSVIAASVSEGYRSEGYEVSTDGGRNFDTIRSTKYLVLMPGKNYIIRPAVSKDFNRVEFVFPNGYNSDDFLRTVPIIPQSIIEAEIAANPAYEYYRGRYFYDFNPGAGHLNERARPNYGEVYDFTFEARKKKEGDNPIVLFTDTLTRKTYQGPTFYYVARSMPTDNIIEVKVQNIDSSKKKYHGINGNIYLKTMPIRNDGEGERDMPVANYTVYFNEQGYGSTVDYGVLKHKRFAYLTDERGHFETEDFQFVGGIAMSVLIDDGAGNSEIIEFTPSADFNDVTGGNESIPMIEIGYSNLIPMIPFLTYDYEKPTNRAKTDFSRNSVRIFDDTFTLEAVVDIPIQDIKDTEPTKTAHERIKNIIFTLKHSDGTKGEEYIAEPVATSSNLYRMQIKNMLNHIYSGDYLTAKLVDVEKKTIVFAGDEREVDITYPEIETGLIFYIENEIVRPKTIDFKVNSNELNFDIPILGTTNPAAHSGTATFERVDWPNGVGYSLCINADLLMHDDFAWTTDDKYKSLSNWKSTVKNLQDENRQSKENRAAADDVWNKINNGKEGIGEERESYEEHSNKLLNKRDSEAKNQKATFADSKPIFQFDVYFMANLDFVLDPKTSEYLCAGLAITVGGFFKASKTFQTMIGYVPCYLNLSGTLQQSVLMGGTFDTINDAISRGDFDKYNGNIVDRFKGDKFQAEFNYIIQGRITVGVGCQILGVRGFVQTNMRLQFLTRNRSLTDDWWGAVLGICGGLGIDLVVTSFEINIASIQKGFGNLSDVNEVSFIGGLYKGQLGSSNLNSGTSSNYQGEEEKKIREYNMGTNDFSSFGQAIPNSIPTQTNMKVLLDDAAERTRPKIKNIDDDHKFLLFVGKNTESTGDASRIYYSIGTRVPGTTNDYTWRTPEPIDTDDVGGSTFDSQPDIHMFCNEYGTQFYLGIAWLDADKQIDNINDFRQKYNSLKISCKLFKITDENLVNPQFSNAVIINKGNYFYQNPKLSLLSLDNRLICTFYARDINGARKEEEITDLYGFYSTVGYSIIDVDFAGNGALSIEDENKDKYIKVKHQSINDPFIADYPTIGLRIINNEVSTYSETFYLVSAYIIDEDLDQTTENDKEIYLSISRFDEEEHKFIAYYPIRLTTNGVGETSIKFTHIKRDNVSKEKLFLSWISSGKDFMITDISELMEALFVKQNKGSAADGWKLSLNDDYIYKDKTVPDWYKLSIYDFEDLPDAKEHPSDPDPRIAMFDNSIYQSISAENVTKVGKRIKNDDNDSHIGIHEYEVVNDNKDFYIFYTDSSGNIEETGLELYGMRYKNPGIEPFDPASGGAGTIPTYSDTFSINKNEGKEISDPVMITHYDSVFDEISMLMTSDGKIDLISNFYKQEIEESDIKYSKNQLTWLYFEPAGSLEVDKQSLKFSNHIYPGVKLSIDFDVQNNGLMEAEGYDLKIEAVKAARPDLLGDIFVKKADEHPDIGTFSGQVSIFDGQVDQKIDIASSTTKHFNWMIPNNFNLENYYIHISVTETASPSSAIIPKTNEIYKKIRYGDVITIDDFDVDLNARNLVLDASFQNIGNKISPNYKVILTNNPDKDNDEKLITYNEKTFSPLLPASISEYHYEFIPRPSDFDEYGRIKFKIAVVENDKEVNCAYCSFNTNRPMFAYINDDAPLLKLNQGATSVLKVNAAPWQDVIGTPSFASHNGGVVKVDQNGKVTALRGGNAQIEVYYPLHGIHDTIKVEVIGSNNHHGGGGGGGGGGSLISNPSSIPAGVTYQEGQYAWSKNEKGNWIIVANGEIVKNSWARVDLENNDGTIKGSNWYHLDSDGSMHVGWYKDTDGRYYFMETYEDNSMGTMLTGWRNVGEKYYYFIDDKANPYYGALLVNTITPDGRYVDENGEFKGSFFD